MKLNKEEMALGGVFGAAFSFFIGPLWAALLALACAFLWAVGGSGAGRAWRYLGVPASVLAVLSVAPGLCGGHLYFGLALASAGLAALVLTMGYGIPTHTETTKDPGSALGRLAYFFAEGFTFPNQYDDSEIIRIRIERRATFLTRGTLAFLLGAAYAPLFAVDARAYLFLLAAVVAGQLAAVNYIEGEIKI